MNEELTYLLDIGNKLITSGKIKSFRKFSLIFLNRCPNYFGNLKCQNNTPSIAALSHLLLKLEELDFELSDQIKLRKIIENKLLKGNNYE